jgi:O-succinylbenzoate synthase
MRIDRIVLRRIIVPMRAPFTVATWRDEVNESIVVCVEAEGVRGWGEAPTGSGPWFSDEAPGGAFAVMREVLAPLMLDLDLSGPEDVDRAFAYVRGNPVARAGLEFAVWDLFARLEGVSLASRLGGSRQEIAVCAAVGIPAGVDALLEEVGGLVDGGYEHVKLKIRPGWEVEPVRAVRDAWPELSLKVDGQSSFTLEHTDRLVELDRFGLLCIEQPLAYNDIVDHAKLQQRLETPVALDESVVSVDHARWALELGSCRVINVKPARVGGLTPSLRIHELAQEAGVPLMVGGSIETSLGQAFNLALASLPGFTLPNDLGPADEYLTHEIVVDPPGVAPQGAPRPVPSGAGTGVEVDVAALDEFTVDRAVVARHAVGFTP